MACASVLRPIAERDNHTDNTILYSTNESESE